MSKVILMVSKTVKHVHLHSVPYAAAFHATLALLLTFNVWAPTVDQVGAMEGALAVLAAAVHFGPDPV